MVSGITNEFWALVWLVPLALVSGFLLLLMFKPRPFQPHKDREPAAMREALSPEELAGQGTITSDLRLYDTSGDSSPPAWTVWVKYLSPFFYVTHLGLDLYFVQNSRRIKSVRHTEAITMRYNKDIVTAVFFLLILTLLYHGLVTGVVMPYFANCPN